MDVSADTYRVNTAALTPAPHLQIDHEGWSVWCNDVKLASQPSKPIRILLRNYLHPILDFPSRPNTNPKVLTHYSPDD
jgi:hypothetical protein